MRIISVGNFGTGWDGSQCDEEHIAQGLETLGHVVIRQKREGPFYYGDDDSVDFVLLAQWNGYNPFMIQTMRNHWKCPIVYWAFDYQADGQDWHQRLIHESDLYLSKPFSDAKYPNWQWLSQDFSPEFLDKYSDRGEKDIDVLFTGSYVPWESGQERVKYLKAIDERFNLQINSVTPDEWRKEGFKNVQGPVMDHELPALIARTKVNFSMDHVITPGYWSDRNAQIMCCGGFVLFHYVPGCVNTFHSFVDYFSSIDECLEMTEHYIQNDEDREAVAAFGYEWAQGYLTAVTRASDLVQIVGRYL